MGGWMGEWPSKAYARKGIHQGGDVDVLATCTCGRSATARDIWRHGRREKPICPKRIGSGRPMPLGQHC